MFFKDTAELVQYVDLNASFEFPLIVPKLREVDRDVLNLHFGIDFVEEIQAAYNGTTSGVITTLPLAQQSAILKFRAISAPFAVALHITSGQVQIDNAGIYVAKNENRGIAWEWQIKDLIKSYLHPGYQAIEDCILYLQKNITSYTTYQTSAEYDYSVLSFVPTAKEFTKSYAPLNNSYMSYLKMRSCMDEVDEIDIQNVLLPDYYAAFKVKLKAGTLTVADKAILPYIKKAIVNITAFKAFSVLGASFDGNGFITFDNTSGVKSGASTKTAVGESVIRAQDSLNNSGKTYLNELQKFIIDNIISYPVFAADPKYITEQTSTVTNEDSQGFYNAL